MDQILAWGLVVAMVVASTRVTPERLMECFGLAAVGVVAVLAQLGLNAIFAAHTRFMPPTLADVLLLRELRAATGLVVIGYGFALSGLLGALRIMSAPPTKRARPPL